MIAFIIIINAHNKHINSRLLLLNNPQYRFPLWSIVIPYQAIVYCVIYSLSTKTFQTENLKNSWRLRIRGLVIYSRSAGLSVPLARAGSGGCPARWPRLARVTSRATPRVARARAPSSRHSGDQHRSLFCWNVIVKTSSSPFHSAEISLQSRLFCYLYLSD